MKLSRGQQLGIISVLAFFLLLFAYDVYKKSAIDANRESTIGLVYDLDGGHATTSPSLIFKYYVKKKQFTGTTSFDGSFNNYENRFFQVEYSSENLSWSQILLNHPVTDTVAIKAAGFTLPKKERNQFQEN